MERWIDAGNVRFSLGRRNALDRLTKQKDGRKKKTDVGFDAGFCGSVVAFAETLPLKGKVVWQTDFSDETEVPKGWLVEGGIWNVENGELVGKATTYRSVIRRRKAKLTNFAMECDATVLLAATTCVGLR